MKLSIIVPVFNVKDFLRECINSLLNQSISDYEIILVDDGSTDGSADIVKEYAECYPIKIKSVAVENGGQGRARNLGLEIACGDYLAFVDSDDTVAGNMFEKMLNRAFDTGADIIICDILKCNSDGTQEYIDSTIQSNYLSAAGSACNKVFRRDIVEDIKFSEGLKYEDFAFSAKVLVNSSEIVYLREALYFYRCGHISTMRNQNSKINLDLIPVLEDIKEHMKKNGKESDFSFLVINHLLIDAINRVAIQKGSDRRYTIQELLSYARREVPRLISDPAFKNESLNRRIIMWLNYHGLYNCSRLLLTSKKLLKKSKSPVFE